MFEKEIQEYLHPFRDGNGRIGRLFSNFILHKMGHSIVIITQESKEEYINAPRLIRTERTDKHLVLFSSGRPFLE